MTADALDPPPLLPPGAPSVPRPRTERASRLRAQRRTFQQPAPLWVPAPPRRVGLSMRVEDGPIVRAAGFRYYCDTDRWRVSVWEGLTNIGILACYREALADGELLRLLWEAFGRGRSWDDYPSHGSGDWGAGHELVDPKAIVRMEEKGQLLSWD